MGPPLLFGSCFSNIKWDLLDLPQFSFDVGILSIFGRLDDKYREKLKENYCIVDKGYNSFPTNIPGTPYAKALEVSNIVNLVIPNSLIEVS